MTTRRQFLAGLGAGVGILVGRELPALRRPGTRLDRIGLQLYTVRSLMQADVEGTLAKVAAIGYREVEFAGYFKRTPAQIKALLSANHLTAPSTHIGFPKTDDEWKATLDQASEIGHEWVVIAWIDAPMRKTLDDWKKIGDRFNQLGTMAHAQGLRFGYHNHDFEFAPVEGTNGLETLLNATNPRLVEFEMDIYWVVKGGGDPLDLIHRYQHRFPMMHAKDATAAPARAMVDVGAGTIDFAKIFAANKPEHVFVEHDTPTDPMKSAENSYRYLSKLNY